MILVLVIFILLARTPWWIQFLHRTLSIDVDIHSAMILVLVIFILLARTPWWIQFLHRTLSIDVDIHSAMILVLVIFILLARTPWWIQFLHRTLSIDVDIHSATILILVMFILLCRTPRWLCCLQGTRCIDVTVNIHSTRSLVILVLVCAAPGGEIGVIGNFVRTKCHCSGICLIPSLWSTSSSSSAGPSSKRITFRCSASKMDQGFPKTCIIVITLLLLFGVRYSPSAITYRSGLIVEM